MNRRFLMGISLILAGLLVLSNALVSYAQGDDEYTTEQAEAGYELFLSYGCGGCHGVNAEGTTIAPALPGHSALEVRRQMRSPMGIMPVFTPEEVPDEDVELLAAFVTSLKGGHMHQEVALAEQANWMYHWLAFAALEAGNIEEALHYVEHISSLVVGEHLTMMQQIWAQLNVGETELAGQTLGNMLVDGDSPSPEMEAPDPVTLHLQLAYIAAQSNFTDEAIHHIEHYIELTPDEDHGHLDAILAQFDAALGDAERKLEGLLGDDSMTGDHGDEDGHDDSDGHDDEEAGHDDSDGHDDEESGHDDSDGHSD